MRSILLLFSFPLLFLACGDGGTGNLQTCADCDPNASCSETADEILCECNPGFSGDGTSCANIDECADGTHDCGELESCIDTEGSFVCECMPGYEEDGAACVNVNECLEETDACHALATCTDTEGGYACECPQGYEGDGTDCANVDECAAALDDCHADAVCHDTEGDYSCECGPGFSGDGWACTFDCPQPPPDGPYPRVHSIPIRCSVEKVYTQYITGEVAIAQDVMVVGMPSWLSDDPDDHASAFLYRFDGSTWVFAQELLPQVPGLDPSKYGNRVEISSSGDTIVVSTGRDAFVFRRDGDTWTGGEQLLPAFDPEAQTLLASVATTDEHTALAYYGNSDTDIGLVYLFDPLLANETARVQDSRFYQNSNGNQVSLNGDLMVVANRYNVTVIFRFNGLEWQEEQELPYGMNTATDGIWIASRTNDDVYIFANTGSWVESDQVPCGIQADLSVRGQRLVTGGSPSYGGEDQIGAIFEFDGESWVETYAPEYEAYFVDMAPRFAVMSAGGFAPDVVQVIEFEEAVQ